MADLLKEEKLARQELDEVILNILDLSKDDKVRIKKSLIEQQEIRRQRAKSPF